MRREDSKKTGRMVERQKEKMYTKNLDTKRRTMVELKTFGFGLRAFKRYPELVPLVSIVIMSSSFGIFFMSYSVATKPDVRLVKSRGPPHEDVGPKDSRKLLEVNWNKYKEFPDIQALRKEIGSFKS